VGFPGWQRASEKTIALQQHRQPPAEQPFPDSTYLLKISENFIVTFTSCIYKPDGKCIGMMTPEHFHLLRDPMKLRKMDYAKICPLLSNA
jgi:hypothetical protein